MQRRYNLVLLDLDGTLADTDEVIAQVMYQFYDTYNGGQRKTKEQMKSFSGPPIGDTLKKEFPDQDNKFLVDEFNRLAYIAYPKYMFLYDYAKEAIIKLKEAGITVGVVTNKQHDACLFCLDVLKIKDLIDIVIGFNDVKNGKPSGEGILKAMSLAGETDKNNVIYVGDNDSDLLTAIDAGVHSALVKWSPRERKINEQPTFYIDSYKDLLEKIL